MAEPAWPSTVRTEFAADKAVRTGRVAALATRGDSLRSVPFQFYFASVSTASASYVTIYSAPLQFPDWGSGCDLNVMLESQRSAANTASWRYIVTGVGSGPDVAITSTGAFAESGPCTRSFAANFASGLYTIEFQAKIATSGTASLQSINRCTAWFSLT